jgi:Na+-transporting NADH:ubiquinone oxidoreductase subunit NqrB
MKSRRIRALKQSNFMNLILKKLNTDARNWQIIFLGSFLLFGIWQLNWSDEMVRFPVYLVSCLLTQGLAIYVLKQPLHSLKSALITTLGLTLLLKTNNEVYAALAGILAVGSKFIFRYKSKHFFNPANFGIIATLLLFNTTWTAPGQWGSSALMLLIIGSAGLLVVLRAQRFDTGFMFIGMYLLLDISRIIVYQQWDWDVLFHKYCNGSLILFTFFMITDPKSTPNHTMARLIWAASVAILTFYLQSFVQVYTAPIWALFILSPFTLIFDHMFTAPHFDWLAGRVKKVHLIAPALLVVFTVLYPSQKASAFCGFYVAKADAKLFNKTSQVILVRDGQKSIITMSSDFQGNVRDFAMVVPVPVVLQRHQIRIADAALFRTLDEYSGPRLVEYYDENPCYRYLYEDALPSMNMRSAVAEGDLESSVKSAKRNQVKIEAQYSVGEYDILLLSAKESNGLQRWLNENGYKIPDNANEVLEPYIKSNMKFFVVKVNLSEQEKLGSNELRPIQIEFDSPKFMLPIRLGMANANGDQDMIVYAFSKSGRVECTNYRTTRIPTNRNIPLDVANNFGAFYKALFDRTWMRQKDAVFLEYAWNVTPSWGGVKCDPCVGPPPLTADLTGAGVTWINQNMAEQVYFTRLHVRYGRKYFPQDLLFQETPNRENFQGRYIITHPAVGDLSCREGQEYIYQLIKKRQREVQNLASLTGWSTQNYAQYLAEYQSQLTDRDLKKNLNVPILPFSQDDNDTKGNSGQKMIFTLFLTALVLFIIYRLSPSVTKSLRPEAVKK